MGFGGFRKGSLGILGSGCSIGVSTWRERGESTSDDRSLRLQVGSMEAPHRTDLKSFGIFP